MRLIILFEHLGGGQRVQTMSEFRGYTQREWDRVVGWGLVPDHYKKERSDGADEKEKELSEHDTSKAES